MASWMLRMPVDVSRVAFSACDKSCSGIPGNMSFMLWSRLSNSWSAPMAPSPMLAFPISSTPVLSSKAAASSSACPMRSSVKSEPTAPSSAPSAFANSSASTSEASPFCDSSSPSKNPVSSSSVASPRSPRSPSLLGSSLSLVVWSTYAASTCSSSPSLSSSSRSSLACFCSDLKCPLVSESLASSSHRSAIAKMWRFFTRKWRRTISSKPGGGDRKWATMAC
mmetsp:Transcript_8423/g.21392  ORF Transcript_8423/g.21392 Transcript_8423/m.21392 type:complete len:223 (-) Transcript_8423:405-1073(-)